MAEGQQSDQHVIERLGEYGARLTALELTQHRDKQETNAQLREIRELLARIESRDRQTAPAQLELLIGRLIDQLSKPAQPPAPAPPVSVAAEIANAMRASRGAGGPVAALGYFMGGGSAVGMIVWVIFTLLGA